MLKSDCLIEQLLKILLPSRYLSKASFLVIVLHLVRLLSAGFSNSRDRKLNVLFLNICIFFSQGTRFSREKLCQEGSLDGAGKKNNSYRYHSLGYILQVAQ